ncbi:Sodium-dependent phosphate transporter [Roseomonas mucosa]|uniref:Na/Pi cotransporter family protein n=1 Tax=Roseomonas TaxID=125216 RepID=UPI00095AE5F6|nr:MULTISPECIES: Na/Pi cotransporter family protein [Roseomonas]ATR22000.1 Na/Pi cotransporter family protein [Roseomonas sp. FDAARGOS_362]QDJ08139.1 Sodium-dependent phosphate transporter [Roseomonas mucosa]USQ73150.1 Na/Pi cotransporter family protein [Roseomonas mucosa]UZO95511.1 Sodium-dependent phosphate transporter [Roseomonas mucosa]GAV32593.1 Na+Pi-cotransporter [Roseomonas sp. TAS13]
MYGLSLLIQLAGEAALLLYGLSLVQRGVDRAYGAQLREGLGRALRDRWRAFAAGLLATTALQSSTAAGLMVGGLHAAGALGLVPALGAMLGANVGTALIAQVLSFDLRPVFPLVILLGWMAFKRGKKARTRDLGRAAIGLGLMLCALFLLLSSMQPVEHSEGLRQLLHLLEGSPPAAALLAALLAWATHSSLAAVLLVGSLASTGVIGAEAAVAMVAGANLGGSVPPLLAARHGARGGGTDPAGLRLPVGNLLNRLAGAVLVLALLPQVTALLSAAPGRLVADAHLGFNLVMAALFLPLLDPLSRLLRRMLPDLPPERNPGAPRYLDEGALATPPVALANAAREVLRMADTLETMLRDAGEALRRADRDEARAVGRLDDVLDRLHGAVHAYLARLPQEDLPEAEARRLAEIRAFAIALEHAGDAVSRNLSKHAARRARRGIPLSPEDLRVLEAQTGRLLAQLRLAVAVFLHEDAEAARQLVREKEAWRSAEREATDHLVEASPAGSVAASLVLDVTRDLKRIGAHLAGIAYPLLERQGELRSTRLRAPSVTAGE